MVQDVVYFVRTDATRDITPETIDAVISFGTCKGGSAMDFFLRSMTHILAPSLLHKDRNWPEGIQKELSSVAHKFMAHLTDNANRIKGSTVLYVPLSNISEADLRLAHQDPNKQKDLVQTFVTAVIHWTHQIRDVVNEKDVETSSDMLGPLAEIQYWRARTFDLNNIRKQFNREDVQRIVEVLTRAKESKYFLEPFLNLQSDIINQTNEAIDNLKYLRTLEEPCRKLSAATPKDVPLLVKDILKTAQMVFIHSKYYKKDRFFRLLRMISNEIVRICRVKINLQAIFDGDVTDSIDALQESVAAGEAWMSACRKMLIATGKRFRRDKGETLEIDESIFSEMNGFIHHRCMNLQVVCQGQLQFGFKVHPHISDDDAVESRPTTFAGVLPCFGGAKGSEVESQLQDIQRAFRSKMETLRRLNYDILDVNATKWSDDFRQFKSELDNLTRMTNQIMQSAFEQVSTVEGGAELLEAYHYIAKREELEREVDKRKDGVIKLFSREITFVNKEYARFAPPKVPPILHLHPPVVGQAFWARAFSQRIENSLRLLQRCWYLGSSAEQDDALALCTKLEKNYIGGIFRVWKESIPENPGVLLQANLLERRDREGDVSVLAVNFPTSLLVMFEEARYWARLGETVPPQLQDFCMVKEERGTREEKLRVIRENVSQAVRAYNNIILSLGGEERRLFACRIAFLDSKYASGLTKSNWNSQGIVEYFVKDAILQAERLQFIVD